MAGVRAGGGSSHFPSACFCGTTVYGKDKCGTKEKARPCPTGKGVQVGERWHPSELAAIDAWIAASNDKALTRVHAIRRLVALGLIKGEVKDWKWIQDPKVLLWIIGGLVFLIWVVLQRP